MGIRLFIKIIVLVFMMTNISGCSSSPEEVAKSHAKAYMASYHFGNSKLDDVMRIEKYLNEATSEEREIYLTALSKYVREDIRYGEKIIRSMRSYGLLIR